MTCWTGVCSGVASIITSLVCYITIWNSPADVTGTVSVDDNAKKDEKGNTDAAVLVSKYKPNHVHFVILLFSVCISLLQLCVSIYIFHLIYYD